MIKAKLALRNQIISGFSNKSYNFAVLIISISLLTFKFINQSYYLMGSAIRLSNILFH